MRIHRTTVAVAGMLTVLALPAASQQGAVQRDSAHAEIRTVLRAFYFNLARHDWEALGAYVLSPKLLERRTAPGAVQTTPRSRAPTERSSRTAPEPVACASSHPAMVDQATIQLDGDWAEVSVPRCGAASVGTDEFRLLYFEERWRFIYTDLAEAAMTLTDR
jgi:hypothetical protein